jgi:hypothetical protein
MSSPGLGLSGVGTPLGQLHYDRRSFSGQGSSQAPRRRRCLLKGCERFFDSPYSQSRYCSPACQRAAARWRRWRAGQTWRQTNGGRECRRQQSCLYRQRVRERREAEQTAAKEAAQMECEGQRPASTSKKASCARPGCYELFVPSRRCPHQRFCSCLCRQALRRVLQRETRWGRRRKGGPRSRRRIPPWRKKVRRRT